MSMDMVTNTSCHNIKGDGFRGGFSRSKFLSKSDSSDGVGGKLCDFTWFGWVGNCFQPDKKIPRDDCVDTSVDGLVLQYHSTDDYPQRDILNIPVAKLVQPLSRSDRVFIISLI